MKNCLLAAAAFALALPLSAQSPYLVEDINPGAWSVGLASDPGGFMLDGNTVYFTADGGAGRELWKYDGTSTQLVKDINPGPGSSFAGRLVRVGGKLLFGADGGTGRQLWQTDGTAAGTTLLKEINPNGTSAVGIVGMLGSRALMLADDGVHGVEPWVTDGTAAGTRLLLDTVPGTLVEVWGPRAQVGDRVYLSSSSGLWVTDGTAAGTILLTTGYAVVIGTLGTTVIFRGFDAEHGMELWRTDGTPAGTTLVKDIAPGAANSSRTDAIFGAGSAGGTAILFFADDGTGTGLWRTDGTAAGTQKLVAFPAESVSRMPEVSYAAGLWWFSTSDGSWRSDGTAAGTFKFTQYWRLQVVGAFGKAYFMTTGDELFSTDGTAAGTTLIKIFKWQYVDGAPRILTVLGGKLYFKADDSETGLEPWVCEEGTVAGTHRMGNVMPDEVAQARSAYPEKLTAAGDRILFSTTMVTAIDDNPPERKIWTSDGTSAGTSPVVALDRDPTAFAMWNGSVVFLSAGDLFAVDGGAPVLLADLPGAVTAITEVQRGLLLSVGSELWYTNVTATGTGRLTDAAGAALDVRSNITQTGGRWYFVAVNGETAQSALYTTEGTPETTAVAVAGFPVDLSVQSIYGAFGAVYYGCLGLCRIDPASGHVTRLSTNGSTPLMAAGRYLYFSASDELWRTDGTAAGTISLGTPGAAEPVAAGDLLLFAWNSPSGVELWRSDGTVAGTYMVKDIFPGPVSSFSSGLVAADGKGWFKALHPVYGEELWRSDGTEAGTQLVADLEPGTTSSFRSGPVSAGRRLFFVADTTATGSEVWALPLADSTIAADGVRVTEGNSGTKAARFTITRSGSTAGSATVNYTTAPVNATAGVDYQARSGTITFAAGQTTASLSVVVNGDTQIEGEDETFLLLLSSPVGASLSNSTATAVIEEDDVLTGPTLDARGSATAVTLTWSAYSAPAPVAYDVYRAFGNTTFTKIGTSSTTQFSDTSALADHAYFYRVIARDANGALSAFSNTDIASMIAFTDDPLVATVTRIKAIHITELRTAIDAARAAAGMGWYPFSTAPATGALVQASHITELRTALSAVFSAFSIPAPVYTDASLTAKAIKAAHIQELRNALR